MGDRQSIETFQWLAYIGQTRADLIHAGNGREVHLPRVPNVKVDGYSPNTQEVFEYLLLLLAWMPMHAKSVQAHW